MSNILIKQGYVGIFLFVVLNFISMLIYPGGTIIEPETKGYSFFYNFLSNLGESTVHQILKHRNIPSQDLFYDNYGAPYLTSGLNISISHSELFVAVCLSKEKVGIDLQIINEKIFKVSNKFINDLEKKLTEKNNLEKLTHLWTIKEAAYKYFTVGKLSLKNDIIVKQLGDDSNLQINGLGKHLNLKSKTIITPNYICSLVYDE